MTTFPRASKETLLRLTESMPIPTASHTEIPVSEIAYITYIGKLLFGFGV